jgi:ribose-phosphate pyrophosphokinase
MSAGCVVLGGGDEVSDSFAYSLAKSVGSPFYSVYRKVFPDGESYVRIPAETLRADRICVVKTLDYPQDKAIVELVLTLDTLREKSGAELIAIVPYMAYSRQDREFLENEAVSIRAILRTIRAAGASKLYTVEIHKEESLKYFKGEAYSVSPYEYMAQTLSIPSENAVVIAPDLGAKGRAERLAKALGVKFDYLVKYRDRITGEVSFRPKEIDVRGLNVIIVDDIISTGGTIAKASRILREQGASSVTVIVAHALLVDGAWDKIVNAGVSAVYAANTVKPRSGSPVIVDVAPVIAGRLCRE